MRKLLCITALFLLSALGASAETADQLLTPDGTLFTLDIELAADHPEVASESSSYFVLSARRGTEVLREIVPPTLGRGGHVNPSMAWEAESGTLYIFWIRHMSMLANELTFVSRNAAGEWSPTATFGTPWNFRSNLSIAVTRKVADPDTNTLLPGISVHAAWWEFESTDGSEAARYAMLTVDKGAIVSIEELDLHDFAKVEETQTAAEPAEETPENNLSVLQHPILSPKSDSVLLTFGSLETKKIHQLTIRPSLPPVANGRLRVPVGRSEGTSDAPHFDVASNSRMLGAFSGPGQMAFYTREPGKVRYVVMKDGVWSDAREILMDQQISASTAVEALRRMVHEH